MKKMLTFLMASAISTGMAMAQDTFLFDHYSENFSTVKAGDWGTLDASGAAAFAGGFNVNATNQYLELRGGNTSILKNTGRTMYKQVVTTPITSGDSLHVSFIFANWGTVTSTGTYLYFCDSNKKPIFGIGGDRSNAGGGNQWVPRLPLTYVNLADSTKNFTIPATNALALSTTSGTFKVDVVIHFDTKTYSVKAQKGTYTATATPNFVAGADAAFVRNDLAFLDATAADFSWLTNTIGSTGGNFVTSYVWGMVDDMSVKQTKPFVGNANVNVNAVDADNNVVKTRLVELPIGQKYTAIAQDFVSFDANGSYYVYDAANTSAISTICTGEGASIALRFTKSPAYAGPFTWAAKNDTANWTESEVNFITGSNAPTAYQVGREIIFNGADTTQLVQIPATVDLVDQNWTINNGRLIFNGAGAVKSTGNLTLNLAATDSIQIMNANLLSGNVFVKGGYIRLVAGGFGSAKVKVEKDATIALPYSSNKLNNAVEIADGTTLTVAGTNVNYQGIGGLLTGNGNLKLIAYGARNEFSSDLSAWGGTKITMVAQAGMTGNQLMQINNAATLAGLATRDLVIDSLVQVNGTSTSSANQTATIGSLSGHKKAVLGALTNISNGKVKTFWKIGSLNSDTEFAGTINESQFQQASTTDTVHVEKIGTGTLTLSGDNLPYQGNTVVTEGTLILKGKLSAPSDTVKVAEAAKLIVVGYRELDLNGAMQQIGGIIQGDVKVSGTLESDGGAYNGSSLLLSSTSTFVAKVRNDSVPAASFLACQLEGGVLNIAPAVSYNAGDVFRVFPKEIADGSVFVSGAFGSVVNADKWDISNLLVDGTVKALEAGSGLSVAQINKTGVKAYFVEGLLNVTGLEEGDTYSVVNTSGVVVDARVQQPAGIYVVIVKNAKGIVTLKAANWVK